jgi:hypothetical protein
MTIHDPMAFIAFAFLHVDVVGAGIGAHWDGRDGFTECLPVSGRNRDDNPQPFHISYSLFHAIYPFGN